MKRIRWDTLPISVRLAAIAFGLHTLLLLVDLVFFAGAYNGHSASSFWSALRVVGIGLLALSPLLEEPRMWLLGLVAFCGFLVGDLFRIGPLLGSPAAPPELVALTLALLLTLSLGIVSSWWSGLRSGLRRPAA